MLSKPTYILPYVIQPYPILSNNICYPTLSYHLLSNNILCYPTLSCPMLSTPILSFVIRSHPMVFKPYLFSSILPCVIQPYHILCYPHLYIPDYIFLKKFKKNKFYEQSIWSIFLGVDKTLFEICVKKIFADAQVYIKKKAKRE